MLRPCLAFAFLFLACGDDDAPRAQEEAPATAPVAHATPRDPGYPLFDDSVLRRAPARFDHIIPRLTMPATGTRFRNLIYEANNLELRGSHGDDGLFADTGNAIAERWREASAGVKKVFALRDALFSQQDHPIENDPVSLVIPASWVSVAVDEVMEGRPLRPVLAPPIDDDAAWAEIGSPAQLFGSFPSSARLHDDATRPRTVLAPERLRVTNARRSMHMLHVAAQAMLDAAEEGPEAVAAAGAEVIARSDRHYFGQRLRREHLILVSVNTPNAHEATEEAKGFDPPGYDVSDEAVALARRAVFRRRLTDGDIGLERFDLARPEERRHAIEILQALIGADATEGDGKVWLFVHGGMNASGSSGPDAVAYIHSFRNEVAEADVDVSRVRYLSRPHVRIGGGDLPRKLDAAARRMRNHDLPLNLAIGTGLLAHLFEQLER